MEYLLGNKYTIEIEGNGITFISSHFKYITRLSQDNPIVKGELPNGTGILYMNKYVIAITIENRTIYPERIEGNGIEISILDRKFDTLVYGNRVYKWKEHGFVDNVGEIRIFNLHPLILAIYKSDFVYLGGISEGNLSNMGIIWNKQGRYFHIIETDDGVLKNTWLTDSSSYTDFFETQNFIAYPKDLFRANSSETYLEKLSQISKSATPAVLSERVAETFGIKRSNKRKMDAVKELRSEKRVIVHEPSEANDYESISSAGEDICKKLNKLHDTNKHYLSLIISAYLDTFTEEPFPVIRIGALKYIFTYSRIEPEFSDTYIDILSPSGHIISVSNKCTAINKLKGLCKLGNSNNLEYPQTPRGSYIVNT